MKKSALFIILTLFTLSCTPDDGFEIEDFEPIPLATGYLNSKEGIKEQNLIISDEDTWNELVSQMDSVNNESQNFSETRIDFSKFQIIAIFDQVRNTGGYHLDAKFSVNASKIVATIIKITPKPEDYVTYVINQPYYIVKIPKVDLPIAFETITKERD